jgi:hypothetical protein
MNSVAQTVHPVCIAPSSHSKFQSIRRHSVRTVHTTVHTIRKRWHWQKFFFIQYVLYQQPGSTVVQYEVRNEHEASTTHQYRTVVRYYVKSTSSTVALLLRVRAGSSLISNAYCCTLYCMSNKLAVKPCWSPNPTHTLACQSRNWTRFEVH